MSGFDGLMCDMGTLARLSSAKSRSISAENFSGEKGKGGMATVVTVPVPGSTNGLPYASVSYGPLLFALAIPDTTDANTPDPSARWKFALDVQTPELTVERHAMPPHWNWPLASPLQLSANAVAIEWSPDLRQPRLPNLEVTRQKPAEKITLVPYGCTKYRISMFPVAANRK
jgi:hypothetical protein